MMGVRVWINHCRHSYNHHPLVDVSSSSFPRRCSNQSCTSTPVMAQGSWSKQASISYWYREWHSSCRTQRCFGSLNAWQNALTNGKNFNVRGSSLKLFIIQNDMEHTTSNKHCCCWIDAAVKLSKAMSNGKKGTCSIVRTRSREHIASCLFLLLLLIPLPELVQSSFNHFSLCIHCYFSFLLTRFAPTTPTLFSFAPMRIYSFTRPIQVYSFLHTFPQSFYVERETI